MTIAPDSTSFPTLSLIRNLNIPEDVHGDLYHISFWTRRLLLDANPESQRYALMTEERMDWCSKALIKLMGDHQWHPDHVKKLFSAIWDNQERALLATGNPATQARLRAAYALNTLAERPA